MAYTIVKSDGTVLTTIADGTINTTSTSLGLPGRNYPGYGQTLDTNFVHMLESFAFDNPPPNPLRGQLWFNTNNSTLYVCPINGATLESEWLALTATASGSATTFGNITVTNNTQTANLSVTNNLTVSNLTTTFDLSVSNLASLGNSTTTGTANIATTKTTLITTGGTGINGNIVGVWTLTGSGFANGTGGAAMWITGGSLEVSGAGSIGIKCDNYMLQNGANLFSAGSAYSNANVASYLPTYAGTVGAGSVIFYGNTLTTGATTSPGSLIGQWTVTSGSRLILDSANANLNGTSSLNLNGTGNANFASTSGININGTGGITLTTGNITFSGTGSLNANAGNVRTDKVYANLISVDGNISAANVSVTNYHIRSVQTGISAAGLVQGTATVLAKEFNIVSAVGSGQGVRLPTAVAGMAIVIVNNGINTLNVYPDTGGTINSQGLNNPYSHTTGASIQYIAATNLQWYTVGATYA